MEPSRPRLGRTGKPGPRQKGSSKPKGLLSDLCTSTARSVPCRHAGRIKHDLPHCSEQEACQNLRHPTNMDSCEKRRPKGYQYVGSPKKIAWGGGKNKRQTKKETFHILPTQAVPPLCDSTPKRIKSYNIDPQTCSMIRYTMGG